MINKIVLFFKKLFSFFYIKNTKKTKPFVDEKDLNYFYKIVDRKCGKNMSKSKLKFASHGN